ncbi:MAG: UvrD-helicase domain-containing protein [candidate division Zixibacteria bacterium]|nr:UvrD-helicase domain-containing protein [candidate division Zixibacteria bacterium]
MVQELFDGEARRAARDLGRTFFVEASAGTGKTRLLCDRALQALLTPGYDPAWLVAITFTEKAAAELSARLRAGLEGWLEDNPLDEQAARALERFDQAQVSTIHSFAASLLRELPVEAGVDPAFEAVDEVAAALLFEQVWEEWLGAEADHPDAAAPWASLWGHFGTPRVDFLGKVVSKIVRDRDIVRLNAYEVGVVGLDELRAAVRAALSRFDDVRERCKDPGDACYRAFAALEYLLPALERGDLDEVCSATVKLGGNKNNWHPRELKDELNELYLKPVSATLARVCDVLRRTALPPLVSWLGGAAAAFERRKEEAGLLDFHDLLLRAARLLARKENGAREYFQRRYRHILLDEFQDTDPLQVEFIFYLAEDGAIATDWRDVALVPGKLFVVGDPKQSIYRFRRADIEVYDAARRVIEANGGEVLRLTGSFRAAPKLVSFVNSVFWAVFGEGEPPYQPAYGELRPSSDTSRRQGGAPAAKVLEGPGGAFEGEYEAAEAVAALIGRGVDVGEFNVYDKEEGTVRPIAYRDFALLLRTRRNVGVWEAALERWGVPFYTLGGQAFYARPEVKAVAAAGRALDNPADELALVATLTSPLFSFHADELLRSKLAGGAFDYRAPVPPGAPAGLGDAFALLARLHEGRGDRPPAATLAELVARTRLLNKAAFWGDGPRAVANVRKVLALARRFVATGGVGLRAFARWLAEMEGREEAEHESLALDAGDDFVRIMTIHAAKGLEFNAVVFADWARRERRGKGDAVFVDRATGLVHVRVGRERAGTQLLTPGYEAAADKEAGFGEAEEQRLDYVAVTRARDLLILPRMASAGDGSLAETLASLDGASCALETIVINPEEERRRIPSRGPGEAGFPDLRPGYDEWKDKLSEELERAGVPEAVITVTALARLDEEKSPLELDVALPARPSALKLGSALHAVMEEVDVATGAGLEELAAAACAREGLGDEDAAAVAAWSRDCLAAAPVREAVGAAFYREMPLAVAVGDAVVSGKVDLLFETGDGLVIVDYKTDEPASAGGRAEREYRDQMAAYAALLARATARAVARAYLVFAREREGQRVVDLGPGARLLARGEALLAQAARKARGSAAA